MSDSPSLARAKNVALRYLAARARSEAQVRDRLRRAELGLEADAAVAWLVGLGYLDDVAYARSRARALGGAGEAEATLCRALAEKRAGRAGVAALDDRARRRLARFLLGRGFSPDAVAGTLGLRDDAAA